MRVDDRDWMSRDGLVEELGVSEGRRRGEAIVDMSAYILGTYSYVLNIVFPCTVIRSDARGR